MLCLKLVVSIGATCSFISCSPDLTVSDEVFKSDQKKLVVGTQTELMSIDPLSVNSLGETFIKSLLYKKIFFLENNKFKSDYFNVKYENKTLKILSQKKNSQVSLQDVENNFEILINSTLWKTAFEGISFKKSTGFICDVSKNCLSKITGLIKLIQIRKTSPFEIKHFVKGQTLLLLNKETKSLVYFIRIKSIEDGEKLLNAGKINIMIPTEGLKSIKDPKLSYLYHKNKTVRLSLYMKFNDSLDKSFKKALCSSQQTLKKILKGWVLKHSVCLTKRNITFKDKETLGVISSSRNLNRIFDIIKPQLTIPLIYNKLKTLQLVELLKKSDFDLYLSEEVFNTNYPILYSAFHSQGEYNSLSVNDKRLDKILDKASESKNISQFNHYSNLAKTRLSYIEPVLLRFEKPLVEYITVKKQSVLSLKDTLYKTFVSF